MCYVMGYPAVWIHIFCFMGYPAVWNRYLMGCPAAGTMFVRGSFMSHVCHSMQMSYAFMWL